MTLHPVQSKVRAVGRRVRRLTLVFAVGRATLLVLAVAVSLALLDFLVRPEDPGIRYLSSICFAAVAAWTLYRIVAPSLRYRPNELTIAQHIEAHSPHLRELLSSAVAFLGQSEESPTAGSFDLRRAVVAQMEGELDQVDFESCIDARRTKQTAWMSAAALLAVAIACAFAPHTTLLAASRLLMPWQDRPWPRRHMLEVVDAPSRLALGSDFEVQVIDHHGHLPDSVQIHYWFADESSRNVQVKEMHFLDDRMVSRLENASRSFRFRAVGGDDHTMPWHAVEVVEPPEIASLRLRVHAPAYTGWPAVDSGENIRAVQGSRIEVEGRLNRRASRVRLKIEEDGSTSDLPTILDDNGLGFHIPVDGDECWTLERSGAYCFEITDVDGLVGGIDKQWKLTVLPDSAPDVTLEKPGSNTFVTAEAVLPLTGVVKEDLAIHRIELVYRMGNHEDSQEQTVTIFEGPASVNPNGETGIADMNEGTALPIDFAWDLASLSPLKPGDWIEFRVTGTDYRPQSGESAPRRLSIISAKELEERITARQSFILGQLSEVLRLQQQARTQTRSLEIQWDEAGRLESRDIDRLQGADLNQRQVARLLDNEQDGVAAQIKALLHELESNRVDSPEVFRRMNLVLDTIDDISHQRVPTIQRSLVNAAKFAREESLDAPSADSDLFRAALGEAGSGQDEVIRILEDLLGQLTQWDSYRRFAREISRVHELQEEILEATEAMRLETLGQTLSELSPQQRSDLKQLSERQLEAARQFGKIVGRMQAMTNTLEQDDPVAAQALTDALKEARRTAVGGQMRESGRQIEQNQVGQSARAQNQILQDLRDLMDTLANRRGHELKRRLQKLEDASRELDSMLNRQKELRKKIGQTAAEADSPEQRRELARLVREQRKLAEETDQLAQRLERLQAQQTAESLRRSAEHQQQSANSAENGQPQNALEEAQKAERMLEEARRLLDQQRHQAEQDLLNEQNAQLKREIEGLVNRQRSIVATVLEIDEQRVDQQGELTQGQVQTVEDLARQQDKLADETERMAEQLERSLAFAMGLRGAAREMNRAQESLEDHDTGQRPQQSTKAALRRLEQLVEALNRDNDAGGSSDENSGQGQNQTPPSGNEIQRLAELKLLKLMQEEINRRTEAIQQLRRDGQELSGELSQELTDLAAEQGQLADLLFDLTQALRNNPEDDPDNLPDLRGDETPGDDEFDRLLEQESSGGQVELK